MSGTPCSGEFHRLRPFFDDYVDVLELGFALPVASRRQTASCCGSGKQVGEDVAASHQPSVAAAAEVRDKPPRFSGVVWSQLIKSIVRILQQVLGLRIVVRAVTLAQAS